MSATKPRLSRADRLAQRSIEIRSTADSLDSPEATQDALREAARLRTEAIELRRAARRERSERDAAAIDLMVKARRAAWNGGDAA
ncbi:hypothetical protein [Streptomyces odonnellii]|uniref:hypothetical protein n=1 Tax=Streptomyces odonnellii TaxID=1417980 RepID=UPI0006265151|nr:hypothetical protein [Streptomyces odonnellii]